MNTALVTLVEQTVLERLRTGNPFTSLDISNALKSERYPVQHKAVAEIVRDIYQSGAMQFYDYDRRLIPVVTEGGAKQTQAFLYLADHSKERDYTERGQDALPHVPADQARDIADSVPSVSPLSAQRTRAARSQPRQTGTRTMGQRQDGALAISRRLVQQMGWQDGQALGLVIKDTETILTTVVSDRAISVRIWAGCRLRICRSKLSRAGLSIGSVTIVPDGDALRLSEKE